MKKHISILAVVFVILAVAAVLVTRPKKLADAEKEKPLLDFKASEVGSFQINNFISGLLFKKDGESWMMKRVHNKLAQSVKDKDETAPVAPEDAEFRAADPVKVAEILSTLGTLKVGAPVASEKDSFKIFEINEHSLHILFFDEAGKEKARLDVGKIGSDFMSTYVRKDGQDLIYRVGQNLRGLLLYPDEEWLKKDVNTKTTDGEDNKNNQ